MRRTKRQDQVENADNHLKIALDSFLTAQRSCRTAPDIVQQELQSCHDHILIAIQHVLNVRAYLDDE